jgi:hypothetical protein
MQNAVKIFPIRATKVDELMKQSEYRYSTTLD